MSKYTCSQCGIAVIIPEGQEPIKACFCEAAIVANAEATAYGVGGVKV